MKISPDSWHYKLYVFMSQWNAAWRHKLDPWEYPRGKNMIGLCPYMRMILIWGPLSILSNLLPIGAVYAAFVMFPAAVNGTAGIAWLVGSVIALAVSFFLIGWIAHLIGVVREQRRDSRIQREFEDLDVEPKETFFGLIKQYIVAIKTRICPVLELEDD